MGDMTEDFRVALVEQSALLKSAVAERDALKSDVARADRRAEELRSALLRIATYFKCRHEAEAVIEKYDAALKREEALKGRLADVWREGYEAAMQASGFDDDPEWDDEGVNPYRVRP